MKQRRVLVTRPLAQNAALVNALLDHGYQPLELPLLAIETYNESEHFLACEAIKKKVLNLADYQHLIFISTNAVNAAAFWIDRYWPQLPAGQHFYAIGAATAAAIQQHFPVDVCQSGEAMNSESLLADPALQQIDRQKVLIFRGHGGREHLKQELQQRGALVDYCEVYQRYPIHYVAGELAGLLKQGIDCLTVSSAETLQLLLEQAVNDGIKEDIQKLPVIVPGQRIAGIAKASGFATVIVAANAGVAAMLAACDQQ